MIRRVFGLVLASFLLVGGIFTLLMLFLHVLSPATIPITDCFSLGAIAGGVVTLVILAFSIM